MNKRYWQIMLLSMGVMLMGMAHITMTSTPYNALSCNIKKMNRFTFNTIAIFTTDNSKVVDFYCGIFGFETSWNGIDIDVEMHLGDMRILLFPRESIEKMTRQKFTYPSGINGTMELSFDVPTFVDVDKEYNRAVSMGAKPIMEPTTEPWGQRTSYVADPEGNLIEISSFKN